MKKLRVGVLICVVLSLAGAQTAWAGPPRSNPIVHVVQKGDLLIHIASQYNVSMQTIIEVNGIANPHSLPIGTQLIIPHSEQEALALRPTATPTPVPVRTINLGFHRTPTGSLWCMGEVANDRDQALDLVKLQVSLYNAGGELLDRAAAFTVSDVVPGHGVAPFAILLPNAPAAGFARYEIELLSAQTITHWGRRHRTLTVDSVSKEMSERKLVVQGTVRNRGEAKATDVRVTLTAYGDDGIVVSVRQIEVEPLPAGTQQEFSLSVVPAAQVSRTQAVVWGMKEVD